MNKKLAGYTIVVSSVLVFLDLFSSSMTLADDLVFRNDFICYDTLNTERFDRNSWDDVSLDSIGNINQINSTNVVPGVFAFYQYNR
ncbi:MAG: hypothetical protein OEW00_13425, partial [candidate division Zixibacteria bacterium]|nr:hypothetical protein [candidate division Zixibacteria bacterium]